MFIRRCSFWRLAPWAVSFGMRFLNPHTQLLDISHHDNKEGLSANCVSFVVMRECKIQDAFTTDRHFNEAGFNPLLKRTE